MTPRPRGARALSARSATHTAGLQLVARALGLLIALGTLAVVTRSIDAGRYADWATILSLVSLFGFVLDPGIAPVIVRRLAQGDDTPHPRSMLAVRLGLAGAAWVAVLVISVILRGPDALLLAAILATQLFPRAVVLNAGTWLQAEHRLHLQSLLEVITAAVGLVALVAAAALGAGAVVLGAVGVLAPLLLLALLISRRHVGPEPGTPAPSRARERELIRAVAREVLPLAGGILLIALYTRVNVAFVNFAEDADTVGVFLYAFQFIEQLIVIGGLLAATLLPLLAIVALEEPLERAPVVRELLVGMALLGGLIACAMTIGAEPFVVGISGEEYRGAALYMTLLAPAAVALLLNFYVAYLLVAVGAASRYLRYNAIGLAFALAGNAIFTLQYGAGASARVSWGTEIGVVMIAALPFFTDAAGRAALVVAMGVMALVVVMCELVAADVLSPVVGAGPLSVAFAAAAAVLWLRRRERLAQLVARRAREQAAADPV